MDGKGLGIVCAFCIVFGLVVGYLVTNHFKKCPEIKVGKETTTVNVIVHDTIITTKTVKQFVVTRVIDTVMIGDSIVQDSANCYSFDENENDGSYIKAEMCSKELPAVKPLDLRGNIIYKPRSDSIKVISRIDTVGHFIPFYQSWQTYAVAVGAAVLGGYLVSASH
jgi:hypothetical protein